MPIWYFTCHYRGLASRATMDTMTTLPGVLRPRSALGMLCLALSLSQGCARSDPADQANSGALGEQKLPFRADSDTASVDNGPRPLPAPDPKLHLPFRAASHPRILPSGTLLTVQLDDSLSTTNVHPGDSFTASVAAPLTMDGDTLIERGAAVTGRVESAQSQTDQPGLVSSSGYFRLSLNAITVEGRQLALQTSSLFARGQPQSISSPRNPSDLHSDGIQVKKGRRLTFRLTAPLTVNDPKSVANRQSPASLPE
jgi:hypothetical protein